jgi:osmotically-inducible protein OsmY
MSAPVQAEQIGVEVKDGIVTLAGRVDSYPAKWYAERAAHREPALKSLAVKLDIEQVDFSPSTSNALDLYQCSLTTAW